MRTIRDRHRAEMDAARATLGAMVPSAHLRASTGNVVRLWQDLGGPEDLGAFLAAVARIEAAWLDRSLWEKLDKERLRWCDVPSQNPLNPLWFRQRLARLAVLDEEGADLERLRAALEGTSSPAIAPKAFTSRAPPDCCDGPGDGPLSWAAPDLLSLAPDGASA